MNCEAMSDFEINRAVFAAAGLWHDDVQDWAPKSGIAHFMYGDGVNWIKFDPCNNPSDAWPIILENKICVMHDVMAEPCDGGSWIAQPSYGYSSERVRDDNPLRAAMIVYLMTKDAECRSN